MVILYIPYHKVLFVVKMFYKNVRSGVIISSLFLFLLAFSCIVMFIETVFVIFIKKREILRKEGIKKLYGYFEFSP